jgi:putative transcriptional regulator
VSSTKGISSGSLQGKLLIAMPSMGDPRFERTVIYMCEHTADQAMGLVVNQPNETVSFEDLMQQFDIETQSSDENIQIYSGGPLETSRGFVLHSADYVQSGSMIISETVALTANVDILRAIAGHQGPRHSLLALGYAAWSPGQLENELMQNSWLHTEADEELLFCTEPSQKWLRSMSKLGIDVSLLSADVGHA